MKKIYIVLSQYSTYDSEEEGIDACFANEQAAKQFMDDLKNKSTYLKYITREYDVH